MDVGPATKHSNMRCFAEACDFTKSNTLPWVFFTLLNCINNPKSRKASHIFKFEPNCKTFDYIFKKQKLLISFKFRFFFY